MSYVIYNKETTAIKYVRARSVGCYKEYYKSESAAKAALTRIAKKEGLNKEEYAIAEVGEFRANIEKKVVRKNLMSGEEYEEAVNTPLCCSPASETYWSM